MFWWIFLFLVCFMLFRLSVSISWSLPPQAAQWLWLSNGWYHWFSYRANRLELGYVDAGAISGTSPRRRCEDD